MGLKINANYENRGRLSIGCRTVNTISWKAIAPCPRTHFFFTSITNISKEKIMNGITSVNASNDVGSSVKYMNRRVPGREEMHAIFLMCRKNQWKSVLSCIQDNPMIPLTSMIMDNHISTTILHQAITSKGDTEARARVIRAILEIAPGAAKIKNGYGSLPLHVIAQRNTKMDSATKELLICDLVRSFSGALLIEGGVGKRTPLHIIFTGTLHRGIFV